MAGDVLIVVSSFVLGMAAREWLRAWDAKRESVRLRAQLATLHCPDDAACRDARVRELEQQLADVKVLAAERPL